MTKVWFAVETWPRYEKKVAESVAAKTIEVFLPVQRRIHQWSDRRRAIELPLFPNYVFVSVPNEPEFKLPILRTNGVRKFVGSVRGGTPIDETEIESIRLLLREDVSVQLHPYLRVGQRIRVRGGSLDGIEGILSAGNDGVNFVVSIELIQRSVAVKLRGYQLEAA